MSQEYGQDQRRPKQRIAPAAATAATCEQVPARSLAMTAVLCGERLAGVRLTKVSVAGAMCLGTLVLAMSSAVPRLQAQATPGVPPPQPAQTPGAAQTLPPANVLGTTPVVPAATGTDATGTNAPGTDATGTNATSAETPAEKAANLAAATPDPTIAPLKQNLAQYAGVPVTAIRFEGVELDPKDPLTTQLTQKAGTSLDPDHVRLTTRRLFATGRYRNIDVRVERTDAGLTLIFAGTPQYFVGRVQVNGVKDDRLASLIEYGSELNPGMPFTQAQIETATAAVKQVLAQNGYYEPVLTVSSTRDDAGRQVNVTFDARVGPLARIGNVTIAGKDPGMTLAVFRKQAKLKRKTKVARQTTSTALSNMRDFYQKKNRLEATVSLQKSTYDTATKTLNYDFAVEQGPVVQVKVEGVKVSKSRIKLLVPIYEEGTIDNDLVNEGRYNIDDFLEQEGYFEEVVKPVVGQPGSDAVTVTYQVTPGIRHKVVAVAITGNKYFSNKLLMDRLKTQKADPYQRSGKYSREVVKSDETSIQAIYRANGFNAAKVTSSVKDVDLAKNGKPAKVAGISVLFTVDEGTQQQFGAVKLEGEDATRQQALTGLMNSSVGQPYSLVTLSGDRDALLSYYLSNGFDQARTEVTQTIEKDDPTKTDVGFMVTEGERVAIGQVLESGREHVKQRVIDQQVRVHPADPLDQSALLDTQRNLYNLALFNEVVAAVQNPAGDDEEKNVLLQLTEAKRWDVTYGLGFEAETGIPRRGLYSTQQGSTAAQQGKAGASERVSIDVSRINLFGTQDSITLHGTYGLLEEVALVTFVNPHLFNSQKYAFQVSGGYSNVQSITTFSSQTLQGDFRLTQKATRKDTFIYDFIYRRIAVDPNSLEISANLIPILSQPVRVGGPQMTWFHDTRQPTPLDATRGSYTSVVDFVASSKIGSQTDFNRLDASNSTYYKLGKYVLARNTRFGFITNYGTNPNIQTTNLTPSSPCVGDLVNTNASCNPTPLPERLYAGGSTSHRGFGINDAGPRDLQTGYPVGGSGVFVNTLELRLPPPVLPVVGSSVSFVLFHDMGNVFQHVGDVFPSFLKFQQPNVATCKNPSNAVFIGTCNFNYFSHAVGLGARYNTPVGPIRLDLSYNLNPPYYPQYPVSGPQQFAQGLQAPHFNFFFSIGQSF